MSSRSQMASIFSFSSSHGLLPVGNGHAACGLRDVLAGGAEAAAVAFFLAADFLAAFFAATFFAGAFLAAVFFTAPFFTVALLPATFFNKEAFAVTILSDVFLVVTFFIGVFLALIFFVATFFGANDFFTADFFADIFLTEDFFAVAISFLLNQSYKKLLTFGFSPGKQQFIARSLPERVLRCNESGGRPIAPVGWCNSFGKILSYLYGPWLQTNRSVSPMKAHHRSDTR